MLRSSACSEPTARRSALRVAGRGAALALTVLLGAAPRGVVAQYAVTSPAGDTLRFEPTSLRILLDSARALYTDLQEDPHVLYRTGFTGPVAESEPEAAYPWNAVTVTNDSVANISMPGNLREADRAYYNYAVRRMRVVRTADPDAPCDSVLALEEGVVGSFADGWIVARTLFGGPAFAPLDEVVFARRAGFLRELVAAHRDPQLGACTAEWAAENGSRVTAYERWRADRFQPQEAGSPDGPSAEKRSEAPPADEASEAPPADEASDPQPES